MAHPADLPRHIEVLLHFLPTEAGGRDRPAVSGYRPQFFYDGRDWDAQHFYPDVQEVPPGATARAYLTFLSPDQHRGRLREGMPFLIREGRRTMAYGTITRLLALAASGDS